MVRIMMLQFMVQQASKEMPVYVSYVCVCVCMCVCVCHPIYPSLSVQSSLPTQCLYDEGMQIDACLSLSVPACVCVCVRACVYLT